MSLLGTFDVGTTGLVAQSLRLNLIASNVANAETAVSADGKPYRARHVVFQAEPRNGHAGQGVKVARIVESDAAGKVSYPDSYIGAMVASIGQEGSDLRVGLSDGRNILSTDILKWLAI